MKMYVRFAAMILTSTLVMFGLMYLNTYQADHAFLVKPEAIWHSLWGQPWQ